MNPRESTTWRRDGDSATIEWGGATWTLGFGGGRFGLRREGEPGERLALRGLAAVGRRDDRAFTPECLVAVEVLHARLLATFEPAGWHGLTVRAAWGPGRDGGAMDLEVQASAPTVGELRRLEVLVGTRIGVEGPAVGPLFVTARDRTSAALSYDGREPDDVLGRLSTLPVPSSLPWSEGGYLELAHPEDVSRTTLAYDRDSPESTDAEYALFGYDLEKGVVLRGRLRGLWLSEWTVEAAEAERRRFLDEPPPLRTA